MVPRQLPSLHEPVFPRERSQVNYLAHFIVRLPKVIKVIHFQKELK